MIARGRPTRRVRGRATRGGDAQTSRTFVSNTKSFSRSITLVRGVARALLYFCAAKSGMCSLAIVLGFLSPSPMLRNQLRKKCAPKMSPKNPFM